MSTSVATDYSDRRRHMRRSVYKTAELMLRGANEGVDCTVIDESNGGVQVELSQALELPEEMMLKFSDMASQLVRRCWTSGKRAGYQYIEIVPAQRQYFTDMPPSAQQATVAEQANFTAFNDFIHISRTLLDLSGEPGDWIYPAERIHALLADVPHTRLQLEQPGSGGRKMLQLFAIPRAAELEGDEEIGSFLPRLNPRKMN